MTEHYRDRTDRDVTDGVSGSAERKEQQTEDGARHQQDLGTTPGKFTDDDGQGTSGEGAMTARPAPAEGDHDVPAAIARPSDPPSHEKGRHGGG
ncbi:hypothetical protein AB0B31_06710 [Catellatospora citrea]|uniref:hypothetical protein n=1 Tax=Catellatospora citrea TaxID=53366 RepID=UPI0033E69D48